MEANDHWLQKEANGYQKEVKTYETKAGHVELLRRPQCRIDQDRDLWCIARANYLSNRASKLGRQHNLVKHTLSYHNARINPTIQLCCCLKKERIQTYFYLCRVMVVSDQEKTPATSYIVQSPLNIYHMSIVVSCLILSLLIKKRQHTISSGNKCSSQDQEIERTACHHSSLLKTIWSMIIYSGFYRVAKNIFGINTVNSIRLDPSPSFSLRIFSLKPITSYLSEVVYINSLAQKNQSNVNLLHFLLWWLYGSYYVFYCGS